MVARSKAIPVQATLNRRYGNLPQAAKQPAPALPDGALIDARAAAAKLAISEQTVWAMAKRGDLPCVRFGERIVRFDPTDLDAWIREHKTTGKKSAQPLLVEAPAIG
jgi:excisionase family DNA binding protein